MEHCLNTYAFSYRTKHEHQSSPSPSMTKSLITQLPWGRNTHRRTWLTDPYSWCSISLALQRTPIIVLTFSNSLFQLISRVSLSLYFFQPPILLQLSSTPLIHSSPPPLLVNSNSFSHKHLHVKLFLFKNHFTPFLKFLLNSDLFLLSPQSNK